MENLASELLHAIISRLDLPDLSRLSLCSRAFRHCVEPVLYGSSERLAKAMRWGCLYGHSEIVRRAIAYGAPISTVLVPRNPSDGRAARSEFTLTLYLAAKSKRLECFQLLLDSGAKVEGVAPRWLKSQLRKMMQLLSTSDNLELLRLFLERGCDMQVKALHCPQATWPLVQTIFSGASLELVQLLLFHGADPSQVFSEGRGSRRNTMSPLSAAILEKKPLIVSVLMKAGAEFGGRDILPPTHEPVHIPIFAAVKVMGRAPNDGHAMVKLCIENTGDVNQLTYTSANNSSHYTTPLLYFVGSICSWAGDQKCAIIDCAKYMLDQGAIMPSPDQIPPKEQEGLNWDWVQAPSCVEVLIDKWGMARLAEDEIFNLVQLLVQRGCMVEHTGRLLSRYDYTFDARKPEAVTTISAWKRLLSLLFTAQELDLNALLTQVILEKGTTHQSNVHSAGLDSLFLTTIDTLLAHGAELDAPAQEEGRTVLYSLCDTYQFLGGLQTNRQPTASVFEQRRQLISLLLSKGADDKISIKGKTALDTLLDGIKDAKDWCKPFLVDLVQLLGGKVDG